MRNTNLIKTLITATLLTAGMAHAETGGTGGETGNTTTVSSGAVHFKGEVVNAACAIDTGSIDQTVQLGQVRTATLSTVGKTSNAVGFNIKLNECDTSVATKASIAFSGVTVGDSDISTLALENSSASSAANVGIQVLDSTGSVLKFDGATFSTSATLINGTNILPFQVRYIATGTATAGTANANANFKVQYQ